MFRGNFFGKIVPQCTLEVREKKRWKLWKVSIFLKCPKRSLIASKHVVNLFWGIFSKKKWLVYTGGSRFEKIQKQIEKKTKFQKCPKTYPTVFKHVTRWFFLKSSCPAGSKNGEKWKKNRTFGISKVSKNVHKSVQTSFKLVLRKFSWKKSAQCTQDCRNLEKLQETGKTFTFSKCPKTFLKAIKHVLNMIRGNLFGKIVAQCTLEVREERRWKIWKISIFLKCPKRFLIASKLVLNLFWGIFFEKEWLFYTGGLRFEKIQK